MISKKTSEYAQRINSGETVGISFHYYNRQKSGFVSSLVKKVLERDPPLTMGNGRDPWVRSWDSGYNPDDAVDAAVLATRRAAFPYLGIDPDPDPLF